MRRANLFASALYRRFGLEGRDLTFDVRGLAFGTGVVFLFKLLQTKIEHKRFLAGFTEKFIGWHKLLLWLDGCPEEARYVGVQSHKRAFWTHTSLDPG